jgi:hypothetical protein
MNLIFKRENVLGSMDSSVEIKLVILDNPGHNI